MYDIIGDIHGHAEPLKQLLLKMDYAEVNHVFTHPQGRQVIYLGDFIDRGPAILETLKIAHAMVNNGTALAVMGNHEFNALAYHTSHPTEGYLLRPHSTKNQHQHQATLDALSSPQLSFYLDWFKTLPTHLQLPGLRIVHACWNDVQLNVVQQALDDHGGVTATFLTDATDSSTPLFHAIETVLKGPELPLPPGCFYRDKEGNRRTRIRIKWYEARDQQLISEYMMPPGQPHDPTLDVPLTKPDRVTTTGYALDQDPVFVGHYWMTDPTPSRLTPNVACLDYSVAKDGILVGYRWDGESTINDDHFVYTNTTSA
ncbi:MAG: metallophosphoesterase [Planctomycetota bacterium]|nr:metallophosphoesterase [Planctomycetota bacterium]